MTDVLSSPVLFLNRLYLPVHVSTVRRAIVLLYSGAAHALDASGDAYDFDLWRLLPPVENDDAIPLVAGSLRAPRVVQLLHYERVPRFRVRLTRQNLMLRDDQQCQYCGKRPALKELNIDHVMPRSRGGPDTWENLVISCRPCNLRKGRRTPDEASMTLSKKPTRPRWTAAAQLLSGQPPRFKEWEPFLKAG